jgi:hypothetical protein
MSSLAAALAASKQQQLIGGAKETTTESIDTTKADSSRLKANNNTINLKQPQSSRLSSLQQYNQRYKAAENNGQYDVDAPLPPHRATNARRRRGTTKGPANDGRTSSSTAKANDDISKSPSEIVFICDVPSDSDDDNDDGNGEINQRSVQSKNNSRRKKKGGKTKGIIEAAVDGSIIATSTTSTTGVGEMVFLCDIPSSSNSSNDEDDDRECNRIGDANSDSRINNNNSRNNHKDRGKGGQRRNDKDSRFNNAKVDVGRNASKGGRGNDDPRRNNIIPASSQDHAAEHKNNNPGIMPTPWSARAREEMAKNDTGNNSKHNVAAGPQAAMPTPWSSHHAESMKSNISSSTSRGDNNNQGFHKQDTPVNVVPTICTTGTSNQTLSATTITTEENELTAAAPMKLKSTIIEGRWADVDSDDSD